MIYSSIDIGSDTIKIVVAKITDSSFDVLASSSTRAVGIKKGMIIDKDLAIKSMTIALDEIEKQLGFRIDKAIITVPLYDTNVDIYNGLSYTEGEISGEDVITCFKSSVSTIDIDKEVVTVFPIDFLIDDEKRVLDPKGMEGNKLESRMLISTVPKENVYDFLEVLRECNVEVIDLSFGVINDFYNMKDNPDLLKHSGAVIDMGNDKIEIAIFNKGLMVDGVVVTNGSKLLDHDIGYIYHLDKTTSRELKESLAMASSQYADASETIEYTSVEGEKIVVNQLEVSQIVEARLEELLKNVKKILNDLTNREISYIIITGGVTNLPGFDYLIGSIFGDIATSINMNSIGVRNNVYTSSVGMIKYYYDKLLIRGIDYTMYEDLNKKIVNKKNTIQDKLIDDMKRYLDNN
jgi:cell division protein FtsA